MRVLVAEDDPGLREVLVAGLREAGYQVDAVDRGDDAIDQLKWYEYDVGGDLTLQLSGDPQSGYATTFEIGIQA